MKCPHCNKDIPERIVVSEAARIHRRKAVKHLSTEEATKMAETRWGKKKQGSGARVRCSGK